MPSVTTKFGKATWTVTSKDKKKVLSLKSGKVQVKKGKRDEYRAQAAARGLSLNAYIIALLEADKAQVKAASSLPDAPEGTDNAP